MTWWIYIVGASVVQFLGASLFAAGYHHDRLSWGRIGFAMLVISPILFYGIGSNP